jgi:hypothetical protein
MAAKKNGMSAEVAGLLANVIQRDEDAISEQLREHVRELMNDAMRVHDNFDDVLVHLYTAGMQAAIDARPKRVRKPKAESPASEP